MPGSSSKRIVNRIIQALPQRERGKFLKRCEPVDLVFGTILCEPNAPFQYVYFPLSGLVSLVAVVSGHQPLEMGMIGNEGMLGATIVLGVNTVPLRGVVQGVGTALRMTAENFQSELRGSAALRRLLNRYLYVLMAQLSQTATCLQFHEVDARLARWLLMTHDRSHGDDFHLTHQFLADMLGVRRSGISTAAAILQSRGLIRYNRGDISVVNRKGLEAASCECYAAEIDDYARLLG